MLAPFSQASVLVWKTIMKAVSEWEFTLWQYHIHCPCVVCRLQLALNILFQNVVISYLNCVIACRNPGFCVCIRQREPLNLFSLTKKTPGFFKGILIGNTSSMLHNPFVIFDDLIDWLLQTLPCLGQWFGPIFHSGRARGGPRGHAPPPNFRWMLFLELIYVVTFF